MAYRGKIQKKKKNHGKLGKNTDQFPSGGCWTIKRKR